MAQDEVLKQCKICGKRKEAGENKERKGDKVMAENMITIYATIPETYHEKIKADVDAERKNHVRSSNAKIIMDVIIAHYDMRDIYTTAEKKSHRRGNKWSR